LREAIEPSSRLRHEGCLVARGDGYKLRIGIVQRCGRWDVVVGLFAIATSLGWGEARRPLTPAELRGVTVWNTSRAPVRHVGSDALINWDVRLSNRTPLEVSDVDVVVLSSTNGKWAPVTASVRSESLKTARFRIAATLLPYSKSTYVSGIVTKLPWSVWIDHLGMNLQGRRRINGS